MENEIIKETLYAILAVAVPIFVIAFGWLTKKVIFLISALSDKIAKKTESDTFINYIGITKSNAITIVKNLNQTIVDNLKEKSEDGKLTEEDILDISNDALEQLKDTLTIDMTEAFEEVYGDVEYFLSKIIEEAVASSNY